jgi:hypothetical protein
MKKTFLLIASLLLIEFAFSQSGTEVILDAKSTFEKWCPLYVLENYSSKSALTEIYNQAKIDDRVLGIVKAKDKSEIADSVLAIQYNDAVIIFFKHKGYDNLEVFRIEFQNEDDMELLASSYAHLMGFIKDEKDNTRYYDAESSMNAINMYSIPEKNQYYVLCFAYPGLF